MIFEISILKSMINISSESLKSSFEEQFAVVSATHLTKNCFHTGDIKIKALLNSGEAFLRPVVFQTIFQRMLERQCVIVKYLAAVNTGSNSF